MTILNFAFFVLFLAWSAPSAWAADVYIGEKVEIQFSPMAFNQDTGTYDSVASVTNASKEPIHPPLSIIITDISVPDVSLKNATGNTANGEPYIAVSLQEDSLQPGAAVTDIPLKFSSPTATPFTFSGVPMSRLSVQVSRIFVVPTTPAVSTGGKRTLNAVAFDSEGRTIQNVAFHWTSEKTEVASVSPNGIVEGLIEGVTTVIAKADEIQSNAVTLTVMPVPMKTTAELIDESLAKEEITFETSLIYKVFDAFDDARLPAKYQSGRKTGAITGMMDALSVWETLSPVTKDVLRPFYIPPFYKGSWWDLRRTAEAVQPVSHWPWHFHVHPQCEGDDCESAEWSSVVDAEHGKYRVWWQTRYGEKEKHWAETIAAHAERTIGPGLAQLMGEPLLDKGSDFQGGDNKIDIALVDIFPSKTVAFECAPAPSFILLSRKQGVDDLVHELMHNLQFKFEVKRCSKDDYWWWMDATAEWAKDYIQRGFPGLYPQNPEHYAAQLFLRDTKQSLEITDNEREYGAYLFPFFLAQRFSPQLIRDIWDTLHNKDSLAAIDSVIIGGFKEQWPEFVRLNWNKGPVKEYQHWDKLLKSASADEEQIVVVDGHGEHEYVLKHPIPHLAARYYHYYFPSDQVRSVVFDAFPLVAQEPSAHVQALVKLKDKDWEVHDWTKSPYQTFCRDQPSERVEELVIILSNSSYDKNKSLEMSRPPLLSVDNIWCGRWQGRIVNTVHQMSPPGVDITDTTITTLELDPLPLQPPVQIPGGFQVQFRGGYQGKATAQWTKSGSVQNCSREVTQPYNFTGALHITNFESGAENPRGYSWSFGDDFPVFIGPTDTVIFHCDGPPETFFPSPRNLTHSPPSAPFRGDGTVDRDGTISGKSHTDLGGGNTISTNWTFKPMWK